jgi:hypothetical protein
MSVPREFKSYVASTLGVIPGEISCVVSDPDSASGKLLSKKGVTRGSIYSSLALAEDATTSTRNDAILITPESHTWYGDGNSTTAVLTWDKDCTHVLGMSPLNRGGYNRARLSRAVTSADTNMLTVSGNANTFQNIRIMHGVSTHDHTLLEVTGDGNTFEGVCFATPTVAAQAAVAEYNGIIVGGAMNTFRNCIFGTENDIDRALASCILSFSTTAGAWNIFENCVFRSRSGGGHTTAIFINDKVTDTVSDYTAIFLNCQFVHKGSAAGHLAVGITKAANTARYLYFDSRCTFAGVDNIVTAGQEASVLFGSGGANGDHNAIADNMHLGVAQIVAAET